MSDKQENQVGKFNERFIIAMTCVILVFILLFLLIFKNYDTNFIKDMSAIFVPSIVSFVTGHYFGSTHKNSTQQSDKGETKETKTKEKDSSI